jgi:hypothetical protein
MAAAAQPADFFVGDPGGLEKLGGGFRTKSSKAAVSFSPAST